MNIVSALSVMIKGQMSLVKKIIEYKDLKKR